MNVELLTALIGFAFVMSITPGPNTMLLLASGVNNGFRATVPLIVGVCVGVLVMLLAVGFGVGQLFVRFPSLYTALKVFSVAYLLWLSWKIATASPPTSKEAAVSPRVFTFAEGVGLQWVNPKAWTLCLTVASAYTLPDQYAVSMLAAALVFATVNVPSVIVWALFGVSLRRFLQDPVRVRIFNVTMALALVVSLSPLIIELGKAALVAFKEFSP
jgi:threonine/homoserine/homoserine lactone efflux protein